MKRVTTIFLQVVVVLIGLGALAFLLWEPHVEGRNAHATIFEIYFKDPFLAYAYAGSIPFFLALTRIFRILALARRAQGITPEVVKAVRTIRYCALAIICFVIGGEIIILNNESDDRAPAVVMGGVLTLGSIIVAAITARYEGRLATRRT